MAVVIVGSSTGNGLEVDTDNNAKVQFRAPAFGSLGCYQTTAVSGAITATLSANSDLFSLQWTNASNLCVIKRIRVSGVVQSTITTAVPFDLAAFLALGATYTAHDTGGTAISTSGNQTKLRTSMGTSLMGDLRIASTGTLTPGTYTLNTLPIGRVQGFTGTATGTQIFSSANLGPVTLFDRSQPGLYPVVLAQNEGIIIQNPLAGPASGTFSILVEVEWRRSRFLLN